jgi:hypothetical protein
MMKMVGLLRKRKEKVEREGRRISTQSHNMIRKKWSLI